MAISRGGLNVERECEGMEDATPHRPRTQERSRPVQEMKGPSQDPCFNSEPGSILLAPGTAVSMVVFLEECLGNNKQPSLVDGGWL